MDFDFGNGMNVFFVSGIDTNAARGVSTITQKLVQTGNDGFSEDIELHRRITGCGMLDVDRQGLTMPEIYTYPCSPHLAAEIDGRPLDLDKIEAATNTLAAKYDAVLLEGAGGLMVPLTRELLTIDYIAQKGYPLIFVTSGRLGSISHTLLGLEAVKRRGIDLKILAFNMFPKEDDMTISKDTREYLKNYLSKEFPDAEYIEIPEI